MVLNRLINPQSKVGVAEWAEINLPAAEVAQASKQLWRVERAFRELKHRREIRPMYHWTDRRIRGHVMVCFLAFYLETRFYQTLKKAAPEASYTKVLSDPACLKAVRLTVNGGTSVARTRLEGDAHLAFKAVKVRVLRAKCYTLTPLPGKSVVVHFLPRAQSARHSWVCDFDFELSKSS